MQQEKPGIKRLSQEPKRLTIFFLGGGGGGVDLNDYVRRSLISLQKCKRHLTNLNQVV